MNRLITICALLLAVQLGLAAWTHLGGPGDAAAPVRGPVLPVDPATVDELRLEDTAGATLVLKKAGEGWMLPGLADVPADSGRVAVCPTQSLGLATMAAGSAAQSTSASMASCSLSTAPVPTLPTRTQAGPKALTVMGRNTFQRVGPSTQRRPRRVRPHRRAPAGR